VSSSLTRELAALLRGTDISTLELRGPGGVCLRARNESLVVQGADAACVAATAKSPGELLHAHPLQGRPLCAPGQALRTGEVLALLRVGELLLPVTAPQPGTFLRYRVAHGTVVGWGDAVADLSITPAA
jgi:acetyl-CoA carboxylase biotin carboxyl carrier protein